MVIVKDGGVYILYLAKGVLFPAAESIHRPGKVEDSAHSETLEFVSTLVVSARTYEGGIH
jgi:hypothetical protein